jgi:hypothetical protein
MLHEKAFCVRSVDETEKVFAPNYKVVKIALELSPWTKY